MWSSRIIIQRSRSFRIGRLVRPQQQHNDYLPPMMMMRGMRWIYIPNSQQQEEEDDDKNQHYHYSPWRVTSQRQQQRRHLTIGRRHGWKGKHESSDTENKNKKNFAKEYLEPAARGELKGKHSSGIPRLAVRKHKGHNIQQRGLDMDIDETEDLETLAADFDETDWEDEASFMSGEGGGQGNLVATLSRDISRARAAQQQNLQSGTGGGDGGEVSGGSMALSSRAGSQRQRGVYTLKYDNGRRTEYWKEEDYDDDDLLTEEHEAFIRELVESIGTTSNSSNDVADSASSADDLDFSDFDFDSIDFDAEDSDEEEDEDSDEKDGDMEGAKKAKKADEDSDEGSYLEERLPALDADGNPMKAKMDAISPLVETGTTAEDFWNDLACHPTMYAEKRHYNLHPESKREPIPFRPKNRVNPDPMYVEFYKRWLYITDLPPALSEKGMNHGEVSPLTALQQQEVQKTVTKLFGVPFEQVFPANETSAFIGFKSPQDREIILKKGPKEKFLSRPITISPYAPTSEDQKYDFAKDAAPDTIVKLENIPPGRFSRDTLARDLFPKGTDLGAAYPISREQVVFPSMTTALIRFESAEQAESALSSESVASRLEELGKYPVRIFRARRGLVHKGMKGPLHDEEVREPGNRLIVDGDMPSRPFHLSHAGTIMLRNLDPASVSKASLTEFFQPFSNIFRDEKGSIEFVTCEDGLPTDRAYVGFERLGEAEAVVKYFNGRARIGDSMAYVKLVKDRKIPGLPPRQQRSERTEEEILKSLNDWEQYVDPEDIKYLENHGVAKVVIDETLRGMRFQNRSFGPLDLAMREEKLEPEKDSGDDYKELVQLYISSLKECVATPENPGDMYEGLHFPGEPIDTTIFENEKIRQKNLMKKRGL